MTTYMICDGNGNALTDGLQEHEVDRVAQSIADRRGESVWVSDRTDETDDGREVTPSDAAE